MPYEQSSCCVGTECLNEWAKTSLAAEHTETSEFLLRELSDLPWHHPLRARTVCGYAHRIGHSSRGILLDAMGSRLPEL